MFLFSSIVRKLISIPTLSFILKIRPFEIKFLSLDNTRTTHYPMRVTNMIFKRIVCCPKVLTIVLQITSSIKPKVMNLYNSMAQATKNLSSLYNWLPGVRNQAKTQPS